MTIRDAMFIQNGVQL